MLLRRAARVRGGAPALWDATNRPQVAGGVARRLSWSQVDAAVDQLAARISMLDLPNDTIIATHFSTGVDGVLATLAIHRAGLIAAPVPLGWGQREIIAYLRRLGARAILTTGRAGPIDCADMMRHVAAEVFAIRAVMSLGEPRLDGVLALDDAFDGEPLHYATPSLNEDAADRVALVTADVDADGARPVARSSNDLVAFALPGLLAGAPDEAAVTAGVMSIDTAAGFALQVVPWLMSQSRLVLHPPFAPRVFREAIVADGATHVVLPAIALAAVHGLERARLVHVLALARRPSDLSLALAARLDGVTIDAFFLAGETGLCPIRAGAGGPTLLVGDHRFATQASNAPVLVSVSVSPRGTLALSGAMTPSTRWASASLGAGPIDTGIPVKRVEGGADLTITGEEIGVAMIGGRRFAEADIRAAYDEAGGGVGPVLRIDPVLGRRVAGVSGNGRGVVGLAARLADTGVTSLAVPGATRHGGQITVETPPAETAADVARERVELALAMAKLTGAR